eukprot:maker-scaffold92_size382268-snap-gene-1.17 protein:Tk08745 transcript:maker-scaffold92_size382268-snap-gene-1.17-mRNA-1 annotation:"PREDICTED: uncharacterized protein LOC103514108"
MASTASALLFLSGLGQNHFVQHQIQAQGSGRVPGFVSLRCSHPILIPLEEAHIARNGIAPQPLNGIQTFHLELKHVLLASIVASVGLCAPQGFRRPSDSAFSQFDFVLNDRAQQVPSTTPVPILRLVDNQNPDGSYTYGYEGGDGTYKLETRYVSGEVQGKYGYYDPTGELREVEYGATPERGFEPRVKGLVLPPPTVSQEVFAEPQQETALAAPERFQEQPKSVDHRQFANFAPRDNPSRKVVIRRRPTETKDVRPVPAFRQSAPVPTAQAQPAFNPSAGTAFDFEGHPAKNINLQTGSYSFAYTG